SVGDVNVRDVRVAVTDDVRRIGAAVGAEVHGTLGHSFFRRTRVGIDYRAGRLRLDTLAGEADPAGLTFRLAHPARPLVLVPALVDGAGPFPFALDTGASTTVISRHLAGRLGVEGRAAPAMTGGGMLQTSAGVLRSLSIGSARCGNVAVMIADFLEML